jgi:uncharacterized protein (UPF0276 family)
VGIGLRSHLAEELLVTERPCDFLEVAPEHYMTAGGYRSRIIDSCLERWHIEAHGTCLNVGGPDALSVEYLKSLKTFLRRIGATYFSDHLCWSRVATRYLHELLPLPFNEHAVEHVAQRARQIAELLEVPLVLENPSYYTVMPSQTMSEAQFIGAVLEEADCGLLLDVNNVYVNAVNHRYDPVALIDALPLHRVVQVHLAGHQVTPGRIIDTHDAPVCDDVWRLYAHVVRRIGAVTTIVEWDQRPPSLGIVLDQADRARAMASKPELACIPT